MTRWIHDRMHDDERGFTLLELLVSLAVLAIIMTPLVAAFIDSIKQTNDVQTKVGASADAQRIASFWTADVQNVDPNGYTPLGSGSSGECPAPFGSAPTVIEQTLATFEWDTASSAVDYDASNNLGVHPKKATWVVEGQGPNAELVRRYCVDDSPVREDFVAGSFWKSGYDAAKLIHGPSGYGQYDYCATDGKTCTIAVSGNYEYSLTVDRRVQGVAPPTASTPPCPVITGAIGANTTLTVAWLPSVVSDGLPPVDQYRVIVTALPGGSVLSSATVGSTSLSAELTGLVNGVGYYVQTQAHNDNGWGILCDPFGPVSPQPVAPGAVTNVGAVRGDQQITVSWSPPTDDGGAAVNTWRIRTRLLSTSELLATTDIAGNAARTGTVTGLTNGKEVYATVSAINSAGEGPESDPSNSVVPCGLPYAPGSYVLNDNGTPSDPNDDYQVWTPAKPTLNDAGNQAIKVTWQASESNGCAVTNYKVYATPAFTGSPASPWTTNNDATNYTTPSLASNVSYQFEVAAINAVGEGPKSPLSDPLAAALVPTAAPGNLVWTPDYFGIRTGDGTPNLGGHLTWTPVPDTPDFNGGSSILGYHIRQLGNCDPGNGATQGTPPNQYCPFQADGANSQGFDFGNMVQVTGTYPNEQYKHYTMRVTAFNDRGDNLTPSEVDVIPGGRPTGSPGNVTFVPWTAGSSNSAIKVSWDRMEDTLANTGGLPIGGSAGSGPAYKIMWTPNANDSTNSYTVNGVNNLTQALGNFTPGQAYTFKVAAVNSLGASIPATSFVIYAPSQLQAPPASSLTISRPSSFGAQGNQLLLTIPAFSTNPGNPPINYSAVCKAGGQADVTFTNLVVGANTIFNAGLTNGKAWQCTVTASTTYGDGSTSTATQTTSGTAIPYTTPSAPGTPTVTAISGGKARISWSSPSNDGGQAPDYFTLSSTPAISGLPTNVTALTYDTTVALVYGTSYTFTVTAHNGAGNGPPATSAAYSPSQSLPVAPSNLTWTPVYQNQIRFNWSPVLDNQPANGGSSLTGQVITISPAPTTTPTTGSNPGLSGSCTAISGGLQCPMTVAANTITFTTNQLSSGNYVNYTFTVAAVNSVGTGPSISATGKAGGVPLTAVTNLTYTAGAANGNIRLDWTPVNFNTVPDNGGQNVTGYNIKCTTGGNNCSGYPYYIGGGGQAGTYLGGFTPGTAYTLSVVANNSGGTAAGDAATVATVVVVAPGPPSPTGTSSLAVPVSPTAFGWLELSFPAWGVVGNAPAVQDYSARCTSSNGGVQVDVGPLYSAGASLVPGTVNNIKTLTSGKTYTCLITARNYFPYSSSYGTATQTTSNSAVPR
ncbi:MAG: fibronectin type III domain-containing protein [Acidimicrobiales bacterium]